MLYGYNQVRHQGRYTNLGDASVEDPPGTEGCLRCLIQKGHPAGHGPHQKVTSVPAVGVIWGGSDMGG